MRIIGRIVGFSHTDWDGIMSNVIISKYFKLQGYEIRPVVKGFSGDDLDQKIRNYLKSDYQKNDIIVVTDISMSMKVAQELDALPNRKIHLDHHITCLEELSTIEEGKTDFEWSHVKEGDSATMLAYKYIVADCQVEEYKNFMKAYEPMVVATDLWDTKERTSKNFIEWRPIMTNMLNLFDTIGWDKFWERCMDNPCINMNPTETVIVKTMEQIKDKVIKGTQLYQLPFEYQDVKYVYGACFGGLYRSEVAEYVCGQNPELAFFILVDLNRCIISYRRGINPIFRKLDLTKIASQITEKSGGHPFACGGSFALEQSGEVIDKVFKTKFEIEL